MGIRRLKICVILILALQSSGCGSLSIEIWDTQKQQCPDSDYDNGGGVVRAFGVCKHGTGALLYYKRNL